MVWLLVKKQLAEIFRKYSYNPKTGKARSNASRVLMMVLFAFLMIVIMGGIFGASSYFIGSSLIPLGLGWLYFVLFIGISVLLGSFGSVFNTYASLYLSKDNDLLLSMPIPVRSIMTARLMSVYLMGLMYSGVVLLPAVVVYWYVKGPTVMNVLGGLLLLALISIFVLTLSCFFGWIVAKLSQKLKNKGVLSAFAGILFFILYFGASSNLTNGMESFIANSVLIGQTVENSAYPVYVLGQVGTGDPWAMLTVAAVVLVLFAITYILVSRSFLKIATTSAASSNASAKKASLRQKGLFSSLLQNEFRHFFSSSTYIMNCGTGIFLLPIAGIALLLKGSDLLQLLGFIPDFPSAWVPAILCGLIMVISSINYIAAPSVSLDAKQLWLLQSLPIPPQMLLNAKMAAHFIIIGLPTLFCSICALLVASPTLWQAVYLLLLPQMFVVLCAAFDLMIGLTMPSLHWTSESTPIKQGFGVFIASFVGTLFVAVMIGIYVLLSAAVEMDIYMLCVAALVLLLTLLLLQWHRTIGVRRFAELQ